MRRTIPLPLLLAFNVGVVFAGAVGVVCLLGRVVLRAVRR